MCTIKQRWNIYCVDFKDKEKAKELISKWLLADVFFFLLIRGPGC